MHVRRAESTSRHPRWLRADRVLHITEAVGMMFSDSPLKPKRICVESGGASNPFSYYLSNTHVRKVRGIVSLKP